MSEDSRLRILRDLEIARQGAIAQQQHADQVRLAAERARLAAEQTRLAAEQARLAAAQAHLAAEQARLAAEQRAARLAAEQRAAHHAAESDAELQRALALSLGRAFVCPRAALEARKRREEQLTLAALGDLEPTQTASRANSDGTVTIGAERYRRLECGAAHDGHTNLCFYLSVTLGDGAAAVQLKKDIAPHATTLSWRIGANVDFTALSTHADMEVVRAYVLLKGASVTVYNSRAGTAVTFRAGSRTGGHVHLHNDGYHYQRLLPA